MRTIFRISDPAGPKNSSHPGSVNLTIRAVRLRCNEEYLCTDSSFFIKQKRAFRSYLLSSLDIYDL